MKNKILYSSGNLGASLGAAIFGTYITFYYIDVLGVPAHLIGLAMIISGIWNAINDPLFGHLSDKTHTRWGRRLPYIRFGALPLAIAFIFMWPPKGIISTDFGMFYYFLAITFIYDGIYTFVVLNWTALFPEMYKTQEDRTQVSTIRQVFGIIGNILGAALPPMIYEAFGWQVMGIIFGVIIYVSLLVSKNGAFEDISYSENNSIKLIDALVTTFTNKSFLFFVFGAMLIQFTFVSIQTALPFYTKYVLNITGFKATLLIGTIFITAMAFVFLWMKIANKIGSKNTILIAIVLYGIGLIPFWFINTFIQGLLNAIYLGIGLAGLMILLDVLISDVIDEDEIKTGSRREGMYFGINGFLVRINISIQGLILGLVLTMTKYVTPPEGTPDDVIIPQPHSAVLGIRSLISFIPLVAVILAFIIYMYYPLHGEKLAIVKQKVKALKEQHDKQGIKNGNDL